MITNKNDEKAFITASVNTVKFIDIQKELKLEKELTEALKRPVDFRLGK